MTGSVWPTSAPRPRREAGVQRRAMAAPVPARDLDLEAAVTEADRVLAEALAELAMLRSASQARGEELAASAEPRRPARRRPRRPGAGWPRRSGRPPRRHLRRPRTETRRTEVADRLAAARAALADATAAEQAAQVSREAARAALELAEAERAGSADRLAATSAVVAGLRGRLDGLTERLDEEERRPIARAARKHGGRRLDEDLAVDPDLRAAVEAALADRRPGLPGRGRGRVASWPANAAGWWSKSALAVRLPRRRPMRPPAASSTRSPPPAGAACPMPSDAMPPVASGACWPGPSGCPISPPAWRIQGSLPAGWVAVPRDGSAVVDELGVAPGRRRFGAGTTRRAAAACRRPRAGRGGARRRSGMRLSAATTAAEQARATLDATRAEEAGLAGRATSSRGGRACRRPRSRGRRPGGRLARGPARATRGRGRPTPRGGGTRRFEPGHDDRRRRHAASDDDRSALAAWETRAAELRDRRDRLAARLGDARRRRAGMPSTAGLAPRPRPRWPRSASRGRNGRAPRSPSGRRRLAAERDGLRAEVAAATTRRIDGP